MQIEVRAVGSGKNKSVFKCGTSRDNAGQTGTGASGGR